MPEDVADSGVVVAVVIGGHGRGIADFGVEHHDVAPRVGGGERGRREGGGDRGPRRDGGSGGGRGDRPDRGPREERVSREDLAKLAQGGRVGATVRIVGDADEEKKERERRRKEEREAKRQAERDRLARLGY